MLKKSQRAEFLPDFQNVCTKIFQNDTSFRKKISKNFWVGLRGTEKKKIKQFENQAKPQLFVIFLTF